MNAPGGKPEQQGDIRAASLYMLVAILLIVFNKATFSYYSFGAPNVLTLSQNLCSLLFLAACKRAKLIQFHDFSMRNLGKMFVLGLTFILYMVFGMIAMKVVSIPMYTTLRRTTVVFVMALEWLIARKSSSATIKSSVALMILGALIAGAHDLHFDPLSYAVVLVYNLCTALYLVLINHIAAGEKSRPGPASLRLDKYDFMFYNNLISIPALAVLVAATGEWEAARASPHWGDGGFLLSLAASSLLAFVLNYAIFWNTAVNSALTQTVSGQAKDVIVVALGFALFDDARLDALNLAGVGVGFAGSVCYAVAKLVPSCTVERALERIGGRRDDGSKKRDDLTRDRHYGPGCDESGAGGSQGGGGTGASLLPLTIARSDRSFPSSASSDRAPLLNMHAHAHANASAAPSLSVTPVPTPSPLFAGSAQAAMQAAMQPQQQQQQQHPFDSARPYARHDSSTAASLPMQALGPQAFAFTNRPTS